jgi:LPXTG-site transpeptidase (sortase) family protein
MNRNLLRWLERGLLALGTVLAIWCAAVLLEAQFTKQLPVEPLVVTQELPGDANSTKATPARPAPAAGTVLGRISAPTVRMTAPVLEGSDDATLSRGAGHIEDTPFPGQPGNIGIAGHRDTVFRPLKGVHVGDPLELTTSDRLYHYRIKKTFIVGPDDVYVLDPTNQPTVTLVTCYPFEYIGHAPRRFIVQAELVGEEPRTTAR